MEKQTEPIPSAEPPDLCKIKQILKENIQIINKLSNEAYILSASIDRLSRQNSEILKHLATA